MVAVRFCPIIFELTDIHPKKPALPIDLPYRMVFAIATKDSVVVYDTQASPDCSCGPCLLASGYLGDRGFEYVQLEFMLMRVLPSLQTAQPLVLLGGLHMETITDLAWAPDARLLAVSSRDGYCRCCMLPARTLASKVTRNKSSAQNPTQPKNHEASGLQNLTQMKNA